jgi:hypothetical protein
MLRLFSTKPKLPQKVLFDRNGEHLVLQWNGVSKYLKLFSIAAPGYLYFLYQLDRDTLLGSYASYTVPLFSAVTTLIFYKFSKFLHRIVLLEGGNVLKIEKYPFSGWGHIKKMNIDVASIDGLVPYGGKRWYNPFRLGKGFFKLKYQSKLFGFSRLDHIVFKIPSDYDRDIMKLIAVGKTVNDQNLKMIKKF